MKEVELTAIVEKVQSELYWNYRLPLNHEDVSFLVDKQKRVNCTLNDQITFNCSLFHDGLGQFFINLNKEVRKKLALQVGDKVKVHLVKDESKYGMPVPEVFQELLDQDEDGKKLFDKLTPGRRRSLLFIIDKPKSENIKLKKGLIILDYLKENNGVLEYKSLNEAFKSNRYT